MVNKEDIINFLDREEKNRQFYINEIERLKDVINSMKGLETNWINPDTLDMNKDIYTKDDIIEAFMKTKVYEGLKTNEFGTVLDTFISILDNKHHSQNK